MNRNSKSTVLVMNKRTGATARLVGIWFNIFAGTWIINVRSAGLGASWFAADCAVL